jgi:hypothetical protein
MIAELGVELYDLAEEQAEWSQATFGTDAERGAIGALKHLGKEAAEAEDWAMIREGKHPSGHAVSHLVAKSAGEVQIELADCLLLLLDANRRSGFSVLQLLKAARAKMKVNRTRTYPKPTSDVPSEHVREHDIGGEA